MDSIIANTRLSLIILAVLQSLFLFGSPAAGDSRFTPLGDLPGGRFSSSAADVSSDGSIVVGNSINGIDEEEYDTYGAFRWHSTSGMSDLGGLPGGNGFSAAYGVSGDGSVIVGHSSSAAHNGYSESFRWTQPDGMVGLGNIPNGSFPQSYAHATSADGSIVVGQGFSSNGEAYRWNSVDGMVGMGDLPHPQFTIFSFASDISRDGKTIVGRGISPEGTAGRAFRWTLQTGLVGLGDFNGAATFSEASAVSDDGRVVVGEVWTEAGTQAFLWTPENGMVGLGDFVEGDFQSVAEDVSADGSVIVGSGSKSFVYSDAFVWTKATGMLSIADILTSTGVDLGGWRLTEAVAVSADGKIIVGNAINPLGNTEAWRVDLTGLNLVPEPATIFFAFATIPWIMLTRRKRRLYSVSHRYC